MEYVYASYVCTEHRNLCHIGSFLCLPRVIPKPQAARYLYLVWTHSCVGVQTCNTDGTVRNLQNKDGLCPFIVMTRFHEKKTIIA
jgi:hypothetical protein